MADGPRRPGPGAPPNSPRTTQPRVSAMSSSQDRLRPNNNERVIADVEDPTTTHDPLDKTARTPKFVNPEDVRTAIVPQRMRANTPVSNAPVEERITTRMPPVQRPEPQAGSPAPTPQQRQQSMVSALAAAASSIAVTDKSIPVVQQPAVIVGESSVQAPRTQVWVATHKVPDDPDERLILLREPDSPRAASFRVLRHRLQERGDPRVIAVTSAQPREGKTTVAVNLALALGECGRARVLLVEANLRTPALAPLFGFMPPECFSAQLTRHKEKPEDAWSVVEVFSPSLHVLAVKPESEARPLLDGPAFRIAMEMLAQAGYEYIVVDTPPVLGAADVNLIEDSADGVLFVALSGTTPGRALRQAVEQLQPGKLLGVTLLDA